MRARKTINQMNVVPYIDVMLVLLVIFMVTAPLINPGMVELPSVGSRLKQPSQPIEVTLRDKVLYLRDASTGSQPVKMSQDQLVKRLVSTQAQRPDTPVVIAADRSARYEEVLVVLDLLQRNGVQKVGLLARPAQ